MPKTLLEKTEETIARGKVTRAELVTIISRINAGKHETPDLEDTVTLSDCHIKQGYDYLMDQWKSPSGKERVNNPFGGRETNILSNFSHIVLGDFWADSNGYRNFYQPMYTVFDKDGNAFDYVMKAGKVWITG